MERGSTKDLTNGNIAKIILLYSIPILIGNVFQQLYSMVDTIIVGKFISSDALAAVGTTGPLNFLVLGFVNGITGGFAVITAQRFGAGDEKGVRRSVGTIIMLSAAISILLTAAVVFAAMPLLRMINTPDEIIEDAYTYIVIIFLGIVATMLYNTLSCILRALGDSKTPLYFLIAASGLNVILDLVFIIVFKTGVAGAALATVISQAVSGILCIIYINKKYPILHLTKEDFVWNGKFAWKHISVALPMAFQFSITAIGTIILQGALNLFGKEYIAAYTAALKVEQLVVQPSNTFGVTMANYAGQNLGAGKLDRIKEGVKKSTIITIIFAIFGIIIVYLLGKPLIELFINKDEINKELIIDGAKQYLRLTSLFYPFLYMIFIYRNVLQGSGHSFMPLMAGVFELIARTIVSFTLPETMGYMGICLAGPLAWVAAAVPLGIAYYVVMKKMQINYTKQYFKK